MHSVEAFGWGAWILVVAVWFCTFEVRETRVPITIGDDLSWMQPPLDPPPCPSGEFVDAYYRSWCE